MTLSYAAGESFTSSTFGIFSRIYFKPNGVNFPSVLLNSYLVQSSEAILPISVIPDISNILKFAVVGIVSPLSS